MRQIKLLLAVVSALTIAFGCSNTVRFSSEILPMQVVHDKSVKTGKTFTGKASYYANKFHGRKTSSGEIFDMNGMTAAHRTLPFGTMLKVTNLRNNQSVVVKVNDRGPFKAGRILDLSLGAAKKISMLGEGVAKVKLEVVGHN